MYVGEQPQLRIYTYGPKDRPIPTPYTEDAAQRALEQPFGHQAYHIAGAIPGVPDGTGPRGGTPYCQLQQPGEMVGILGLSKEEKERAATTLGQLYSAYVNSFKDMKECQKLIKAAQAHLRNNPSSEPRVKPLLDRAFALYKSFEKIWDDSFKLLNEAEKKGIAADFFKKTADMYLQKATAGLVKMKDGKSNLSLSLKVASGGEFGAAHQVGSPVHLSLGWVIVGIVATSMSIALVLWAISKATEAAAMHAEMKNKHLALDTAATAISEITKMVAEKKITAKEGETMLKAVKEAQEPALTPASEPAPGASGKFLKTIGVVTLVGSGLAVAWYGYRHGWFDRWIQRSPLSMLPRRSYA